MRNPAFVLFTLALTARAWGGGYLGLDDFGAPSHWGSMPITLNLDQGTLGKLSNSEANALVMDAANHWSTSQISTSAVSFSQGSQLAVDQTGAEHSLYLDDSDGINAVAYDTDGSIIEAEFGLGNSFVIVGAAGFVRTDATSTIILEGRAILNGLFIDNGSSPQDIPQANYTGVVVHELGHMLNMDHSQFNVSQLSDVTGHAANADVLPTMYPIVHDGIDTLTTDDKAWISNLYPSAAFTNGTSAFAGVVRDTGGSAMDGVNIVAHSTTDPIGQAISCVSGYLDTNPSLTQTGTYKIPGLTPDTTWVIDFEQIHTGFTGGSGVGRVHPPPTIGSPPEYVNDTGENTADDVKHSTTFVAPAATGTLGGLDLRLNTPVSNEIVSESDAGVDIFTPQLLTPTPGVPMQVNGSIDPNESGTKISLGAFSIEDWYAIAPPAGQELTSVSVAPSAGVDVSLFIVSFDEAGLGVESPASSTSGGAGATETISNINFDTTRFGTGAAAGRIYLGISAEGATAGTYVLTLKTSVGDSSALMVSGIGSADVNVASGTVTILGNGFSAAGGGPAVAFSDPNITVNNVTVDNSSQLTVSISAQPGFTPGSSDVTVTNSASAGAYSGKRLALPTVPVELSDFTSQ